MNLSLPKQFAIGLACVVLFVGPRITFGSDSLIALPTKFTLTGPKAHQRLLVEKILDGQIIGQVTTGVQFESSDAKVVQIVDGIAIPKGNGRAQITVRAGQKVAKIEISVVDFEKPHQWSFRNHVLSVLSKAGCNSGACHGALAGKNGFKLSLHAYDPETDFHTITRQSRGRRLIPSDPGRSLLLTKPSGGVPHKGGLRFSVDSPEYRTVAEWIAAGQTPPSERDSRLVRLEILPSQSVLRPGDKQQLVVRAHFSDGHAEDVTRWARYTSTNQTVADVNKTGLVNVTGRGEGAIVAWYLSNNVIGTISSPFSNQVSAEVFTKSERTNFIDELVLAKLKSLNLPPSHSASDGEFQRRVFLDTIGILPTASEVRSFHSDRTPDKRNRLIDKLLTRPEFVDYWSNKWSDVFLLSGKRLRPQALKTFYQWIRTRVQDNTGWDEFAAQIVLARGSTFENGAANFYSLHQDPLDMAETVSKAFLGMSINCARCHNHPLEKWTNDDYYGMASIFARVRGKGWGGDFRNGDGKRTVFISTEGELVQPRTGRPQLPRPLDGEDLAFDAPIDRRQHLVKWLTAPENPYFAKAIANRVWTNFMGVGLVEKVDDLRLTNPPSNAVLLTALANYLIEQKYDLKALMRLVMESQSYQRSSQSVAGNEPDQRFYSRFFPRRLKAEVMLDAISQATEIPTIFKDYPIGTRAMQLPDANVTSGFLSTFGRPERLITCACERSNEPSMVQVLHIVNGDTLNGKLAAKGSIVERLVSIGLPDFKIVEELYLSALSRYPTNDEMLKLLGELKRTDPKERRLVFEDLAWSILSSKEFLFNH